MSDAPQYNNNKGSNGSRTQLVDRMELFDSVCQQHTDAQTWRMDQFLDWADQALDDESLHMIFHRLYGTGVLPSAYMEKELVAREWRDWQATDIRLWTRSSMNGQSKDAAAFLSPSLQRLFSGTSVDAENVFPSNPGWGGIGGFDGRGGLGHGIMYVIDRRWWDSWMAYVGWSWNDKPTSQKTLTRPRDLSNENLLDRSGPSVAGSFGSYELMKSNLVKGEDYV